MLEHIPNSKVMIYTTSVPLKIMLSVYFSFIILSIICFYFYSYGNLVKGVAKKITVESGSL